MWVVWLVLKKHTSSTACQIWAHWAIASFSRYNCWQCRYELEEQLIVNDHLPILPHAQQKIASHKFWLGARLCRLSALRLVFAWRCCKWPTYLLLIHQLKKLNLKPSSAELMISIKIHISEEKKNSSTELVHPRTGLIFH